jgi:hypothetical protein
MVCSRWGLTELEFIIGAVTWMFVIMVQAQVAIDGMKDRRYM